MREVNIYIQSGINSTRPVDGTIGYILEMPTAKGPVTYTAFENVRATANRSELLALTAALRHLKEKCRLTIYTDNEYLTAAFTENWTDEWTKNSWLNSKGLPLAHAEEWQELLALLAGHEYSFALREFHGYWHWLCNQIEKRTQEKSAQKARKA